MTEDEKLTSVKKLVKEERLLEALDIARTMTNLGQYTGSIQSAWLAHTNPEYYMKIRRKPSQIVIRGVGALRAIAKNL